MKDERRHLLEHRERVRQALRDWMRRGGLTMWRQDGSNPMEMPREKKRDQLKRTFREISVEIKTLFGYDDE